MDPEVDDEKSTTLRTGSMTSSGQFMCIGANILSMKGRCWLKALWQLQERWRLERTYWQILVCVNVKEEEIAITEDKIVSLNNLSKEEKEERPEISRL